MKPKYFILNGNDVLGTVYEKERKKIIFMHTNELNVEFGIKFIDDCGKKVEDNEVEEMLSDFMFRKEESKKEI